MGYGGQQLRLKCAQVHHQSPAGTFTRVPGRCLRWSPTPPGPGWSPAVIKICDIYIYIEREREISRSRSFTSIQTLHTHTHTTFSHTNLSHTTLSHTIFHVQLSHTHTQLSRTQIFHTQLCHIQLSHTHTQLCHTRHPLFLCVAGVALLVLGWVWWRAWSRIVARGAAALCVAGVALGDIHIPFAWQVWLWVTSTFPLHGRRGTWRHPRCSHTT